MIEVIARDAEGGLIDAAVTGSIEITLAAVQPPVVIPPEPEPDPVEPNPEDPSDKPPGYLFALDRAAFFSFSDSWRGGSAYYRWQDNNILKGLMVNVEARRLSGARNMAIPDDETLTLTCDGKPIATATSNKPGSNVVDFNFPLTGIDDGWHVLSIKGHPTMLYPVFAMKGAEPVEAEWMPVYTSTHESAKTTHYTLDWVPTNGKPIAYPLAERTFTPFSDTPDPSKFIKEQLIPFGAADMRIPAITKEGVMTSENRQRYLYGDSHRKIPRYPLLDGPRNVGNIHGAVHLMHGTGRQDADVPGSPLMGNIYGLDGWRCFRISPSGTVTTLFGYRTNTTAKYWRDVQNTHIDDEDSLELVGDWSGIPRERWGMHDPWGMCIDPESVKVDTTHAPIESEGGRRPHFAGKGPRFLVADAQMNRILGAQFDATAHSVAPVMSEVITDILDPFDCVEWNGSMIVSERGSHRIVQYSMQGMFERIICQGAALSHVNKARHVIRDAPIEEIRKQECSSPEGLFIIDDDLFFGDTAMAQIKFKNLVTMAPAEVRLNLPVSWTPIGDKYIKLSGCTDDSFGPKGTLFYSQWKNWMPKAVLPNGKGWQWAASGQSMGYNMSIAIGGGRAVVAGSRDGLAEFRLRTDEPKVDTKRYKAGKTKYYAKGYNVRFGVGGYDPYGQALPIGEDPDIDYYLQVQGTL